MFLNRNMNRENEVHLHNEGLHSCSKKGHYEIFRLMDITRKKITLSALMHKLKDRYGMYSFICG